MSVCEAECPPQSSVECDSAAAHGLVDWKGKPISFPENASSRFQSAYHVAKFVIDWEMLTHGTVVTQKLRRAARRTYRYASKIFSHSVFGSCSGDFQSTEFLNDAREKFRSAIAALTYYMSGYPEFGYHTRFKSVLTNCLALYVDLEPEKCLDRCTTEHDAEIGAIATVAQMIVDGAHSQCPRMEGGLMRLREEFIQPVLEQATEYDKRSGQTTAREAVISFYETLWKVFPKSRIIINDQTMDYTWDLEYQFLITSPSLSKADTSPD